MLLSGRSARCGARAAPISDPTSLAQARRADAAVLTLRTGVSPCDSTRHTQPQPREAVPSGWPVGPHLTGPALGVCSGRAGVLCRSYYGRAAARPAGDGGDEHEQRDEGERDADGNAPAGALLRRQVPGRAGRGLRERILLHLLRAVHGCV